MATQYGGFPSPPKSFRVSWSGFGFLFSFRLNHKQGVLQKDDPLQTCSAPSRDGSLPLPPPRGRSTPSTASGAIAEESFSGRCISKLSARKREVEVLFPVDSCFEVGVWGGFGVVSRRKPSLVGGQEATFRNVAPPLFEDHRGTKKGNPKKNTKNLLETHHTSPLPPGPAVCRFHGRRWPRPRPPRTRMPPRRRRRRRRS